MNGGFPDTPLMKRKLLDYMTYIFDTMAPRNFDKVSDLFVGDFVRDVKDNLDLDEESIELMDKAMERMK